MGRLCLEMPCSWVLFLKLKVLVNLIENLNYRLLYIVVIVIYIEYIPIPEV